MPFPANGAEWPPKDSQPVYAKMAEWSAWYSGEPARIVAAYANAEAMTGVAVPWYRFWHRAQAANDGSQRAFLHVPVASDLAAVSSSLLFAAPPRYRIRAAHEDETPELEKDPTPPGEPDEDPAPKKKPDTPEAKAERRMLDILERGAFDERVIEGAETGAAIGGVYLYPVWDKDLFDHPVVAVAQADMAIPEFRWGYLSAVTFWRDVRADNDSKVYRHLERHEVEGTGDSRRCVVLHKLFLGTNTSVGQEVPLTQIDETSAILPKVTLPFKELDVEYVPNRRPNRLWRASGHGVADIQGSESLLDALDETWASLMRDIRLAKARIVVPRDYLRADPDNEQAPTFDIDQEIYTPLEMEPTMSSDARAMLAHQFLIRVDEHMGVADGIIARVVSNAGYDPATMQGGEVAGATGAALRVAQRKTVLTQRRKSATWQRALANLTYHMNLIDKEEFGASDAVDLRPTVKMTDVNDSPLELAQTALALKSAEAASIEARVRIVNPDASDAEIKSEVARIKDEKEAAKPAAPAIAQAQGQFGRDEEPPEAAGNKPQTVADGTPGSEPPPPAPFAKRA